MTSMTLTRTSPLTDVRTALGQAQKPPHGTPAYSRWVNRPGARHLTAVAYRAGLSPDAATAISATCSTAAIVLIAAVQPTPLLGVVIGLLLMLGYAWDSVDGQLARLTGTGSARGEWLDHTVDCVKTSALHLAVLVSFYRYPGEGAWLAVPLLYALVAAVLYFGLILTPKLRPADGRARPPAEHPLRPWLLLPTDYGALCVAFLAFGLRPWFGWVYAGFAACTAVMLVLAWRKWWRQLSAEPA